MCGAHTPFNVNLDVIPRADAGKRARERKCTKTAGCAKKSRQLLDLRACFLFFFVSVRRLYNLYPSSGGGYGSGTIKKDDFFRATGFGEDNDVSKHAERLRPSKLICLYPTLLSTIFPHGKLKKVFKYAQACLL